MIVKVTSYTRTRNAAKATTRYIMHRPDSEGERATRTLFGEDGPMERYHGYWMVDDAPKGTLFYRIAVSPDPNREDTYKDLDLWKLTQTAMAHLKAHFPKDIQFMAVSHDDQTDIRHINALVLVGGRLSKEEFKALPKLLKQGAWAEAKLQRQQLDDTAPEEEQVITTKLGKYVIPSVRREDGPTRPAYIDLSCPSCGPTQNLWHIDDHVYMCFECGSEYDLGYSPNPKHSGLQLSL